MLMLLRKFKVEVQLSGGAAAETGCKGWKPLSVAEEFPRTVCTVLVTELPHFV